MKSFVKALLLMGVAMPAGADTALVVGTVDAASTTSYGAPRYLGTALTPLDQAGFELISALDADAATLRQLVTRLVTADEQEALVIALSGRFVSHGGLSWFLGRDAGQQDLGSVSGAGIPVQLLMDIAAASPARAVILLAPEDQGIALGAGLENGLGPLEVPEGVTLATGHPASVARFLRSGLLEPGRPLRDVLAASPDLTVVALADPFVPFIPAPVVTPVVPADEQAYWEAMSTLDNVFAYRAYLNRYPGGYYAAQAQARIAALEPPAPQLTPEEAENALGLSREDKRDIQRDLAVLGYYNSGIDGLFGPGTRGGIRQWQQANGLQVTGYLDAAQVTRLSDQGDVRREEIRAQDLAYWNQTGQGNDEAGLRAYLNRYPNGQFAQLARQRLDAIEAEQERQADIAYWNQTGRGQDEAGLRAYLGRYPNGEFSQLARQRLNTILAQQESQAWQLAQARDTIAGYRAYLNDYPNGPHAAQARQRLAQLQQAAGEPAAWQQAQARDTLNSYQAYLDAYPNGAHAAEARALMRAIRDDDRAWNLAESTDTIQGYRNYLNAFPTPRHRQEALDRISQIQADEQAWQQAQAADTVQAYRSYLNRFPNGRHAAEAQQRIDALAPPQPPQGGIPLNLGQRVATERALSNLGFDPGPADGTFTAQTYAALRAYQQARGLPVTGVVDAVTAAALLVEGMANN
ncbi:peptidoglycan-binding protein [Nioella sp.]|uniref:peptidoglycan-binding protein n=1 Tax=Nioella sp. TaxID=1912091 RepID=UPI003B529345